ncbi:LLM class flavin-dependent oxidoreductase [Dietzia natronolimnaea]|uniref:LLM class flavin-dependent oxidoreductase n=1 Tax=Dietzia natronolimnaea TaxID=161920 RepID=A0A2A2WKZ5_9ACTN|nr:LLM class oxidoreductase [Dietzia natronolimnaea]PAY21879.1 LLM class flavin-dependent oxidoreductase [Dietzia natronolimnaea]
MTTSPLDVSDGDPRLLPGYRRTFGAGHLTLGLGFPLRTRADQGDGSDLTEQIEVARAAEAGGFSALYARDIPLRVPSFGDVGQIYDPWVFLTYVAAHTSRIALGTAAVVLPVRHPLHVAKSAASLDRLSGGRFLLGVASGDRPEEFRAFGLEQGRRGESFRENLTVMTHALTTEMRGIRWSGGWMHSADVVPKPTASTVPVIMTGSCQQSISYLAAHGHGWLTYPRDFDVQRRTVARWREVVAQSRETESDDDEVFSPFAPFAQSLQIDLADDPDEAASPISFGFRIGHRRLVEHLTDLRGIGVNHVLLGLAASRRPIRDVVAEFVDHVVPHFPALAP